MTSATPAGLQVTADNWQTPPHLSWAFQHISELFPTAEISRGTGPVAGPAGRGDGCGDRCRSPARTTAR